MTDGKIRQITALTAILAILIAIAIATRPALADNSSPASPVAASTAAPIAASSGSPTPGAAPTLGPQGMPELQTLANAGTFADLRWPDFSDYRAQVAMLYTAGGYAPAWSNAGKPTPQALAMIEAFKHADLKGLNPEDYDASRWDARVAKLAPAVPSPAATDEAHFDLAITICAMRLLSDLSIGRVNPHYVKFSEEVAGKNYDLADFLRDQVLPASDVDTVIATVEPHYAGYTRAQAALDAYVKLAAQGDGTPLPAVQKGIRPGGSYAGVPQLAARLRQLGDLALDSVLPADSTKYDGAVVDGVKHFQVRHGLEPDGVLGKGTVTDLNTPLSHRMQQIQLSLERYRWIPPSFQQPPILVNLPEFILRTMRRQPAPFLTMCVVVGKAYRKQTPVFTGNMRYIIFRPYWNVPPSIQRAEMVPKLSHDRNYLAANDFQVVDGNEVVSDGAVSDEVFSQLRAGSLSIRQKPGPKNALGLLKFIFPNSFDVYLHSTPAHQLFAKARRDFSHGCIRVQDPLALAAWVLRDDPDWNEEKIAAAMNGDKTLQVNLVQPVPVLILYSTAVVEPDGEVRFFDDIYHYDSELGHELAHGYPYPSSSATEASRLLNHSPHRDTEKPY